MARWSGDGDRGPNSSDGRRGVVLARSPMWVSTVDGGRAGSYDRAMTPILYRLRATVRSQRGSTAALIVIIGVVVAVVLAIAAGANRTMTAPDRYTDSV